MTTKDSMSVLLWLNYETIPTGMYIISWFSRVLGFLYIYWNKHYGALHSLFSL